MAWTRMHDIGSKRPPAGPAASANPLISRGRCTEPAAQPGTVHPSVSFQNLIIHLTHSRPSAHGPRRRRAGDGTCDQSCRPAWLRPTTATTKAADLLVQSQMRDLDNQVPK